MNILKNILLIALGFAAYSNIIYSDEALSDNVMKEPGSLFLYPILVIISAYYLQWLLRVFMMPVNQLSVELQELIHEQSQSKRKLYKTISNFGYLILVLNLCDLILISFLNRPQHSSFNSVNQIEYALFLLVLGVIIESRERFILLANYNKKQD